MGTYRHNAVSFLFPSPWFCWSVSLACPQECLEWNTLWLECSVVQPMIHDGAFLCSIWSSWLVLLVEFMELGVLSFLWTVSESKVSDLVLLWSFSLWGVLRSSSDLLCCLELESEFPFVKCFVWCYRIGSEFPDCELGLELLKSHESLSFLPSVVSCGLREIPPPEWLVCLSCLVSRIFGIKQILNCLDWNHELNPFFLEFLTVWDCPFSGASGDRQPVIGTTEMFHSALYLFFMKWLVL